VTDVDAIPGARAVFAELTQGQPQTLQLRDLAERADAARRSDG
jgi:hypothetical protein